MKASRKNKLRCTAVPKPCVQLCIRRKLGHAFEAYTHCTRKHLRLNHPPFWLLGVVKSWSGTEKKNILKNGTAIFGRTGPTSQRGPPLELDHFYRKISTWAEPFHLCLDRSFRKFWHNGKHPMFYILVYLVRCFQRRNLHLVQDDLLHRLLL